MSDPIELIVRGGDGTTAAYACRTCRHVTSQREVAAQCCLCAGCGAVADGTWRYECPPCVERRLRDSLAGGDQRERARLSAALAIPESAHGDGWVYWHDGCGPQYGYFESPDALREWCLDEGHEPPARVWACEPHGFSLDAQRIVDSELESGEHHEDAGDQLDAGDIHALQEALDAWCAARAGSIESWTAGRTAVELDPAAWTELLRKSHASEEMTEADMVPGEPAEEYR